MKKRIDVIVTKESFHNFSSFTDVEELNKAVQRLMTKLVTLRMIKQIAMKRKKICVKLLMQLSFNQL